MVTVGGEGGNVTVRQPVQRAIVGLASTDIQLIVGATGLGPAGPIGPQGHSPTVHTQADPPAPENLWEGDIWVKNPPVLSPQPIYLWDGDEWLPMYGETVELDDLTGITITDPATGDVIRFNGTEFVNESGDDLYQPLDADLSSIAGLDSVANTMLWASAPQVWELTAITDDARTLLSGDSVGVMRTFLSVYSQAQVGPPEANFVQTFETGLQGTL